MKIQQCLFHKYFFYCIGVCCLISFTEEKQSKIRKISGEFAMVWRNLFGGAQYSIKGIETHDPSNWTKAAAHCRNKTKSLFCPQNWEDVEKVGEEIERLYIKKLFTDLPIFPPIKVWTCIAADSPTPPYFLKNEWLNKKIGISNATTNSAITNQTYYAAIYYNIFNISAEIHPSETNLTFFCEKSTMPPDKSTTRSPRITTVTKSPKTASVSMSTKMISHLTGNPTEVTYQQTEDNSNVTESALYSVNDTYETTDKTSTAEISQTASTALSNDTFQTSTNMSEVTTLQISNVTLQSPKSTVQTTESTVPATESTVPATESTVPTTKSTVPTTKSTVPTTKSTIPTTKSTVPTTKSTIPTTKSTIPTTKSTVPTTKSTVPATKTTVQITESTVPTSESTVQTTESTVQTTESTVQTSDSTVQTTESTLQTTESTLQTTESTLQTTESTVQTTECTVQATENTVKEIESTVEGIESTLLETENTVKEIESTVEGIESTLLETESTVDESSTTTNGTPAEESRSICEAKRVPYKGMEIRLPETEYDQVAEPPCPRGTYGAVRWKCSSILRNFEASGYVTCKVVNCSERKEKPTSRNDSEYMWYKVTRLSMCEEDDDEVETVDFFDMMKQQRKEYQDKKGKIETNWNPKQVKKDMSKMLDMYDRLMDKDAKVWNRMKEETRRATSMEIIKETEETAWTIGCMMQEACMTKENLAVEIFNLKQDQSTTDIQLALSTAAIGSVQLPGNLRPRTENLCRSSVEKGVVAAYGNVNYLDPNDTRVNISSGVIGVSVDQHSTTYHLPDNGKVRLVLYHPPKPKNATALCVFLNWNVSEADGTLGVWDKKGCENKVWESGDNFTVCECDHLTNFAVLMDFRGTELGKTDKCALNILSILCCSLSSIALLLTIIIYLTIRSLRSRRSTITCNLAACLLGMNILIQTALDRGKSVTVCKIASALIQYCVLSAFFWMLLEGALLYKMVIVVFETKKISLRILYSIAYGIPFFIVALSSAVDSDTMIREYYCWPAFNTGHIWSVLGPVILVISVNFIILCLTLNAALKMDKMTTTNSNFSIKTRKRIVKQRMKGMFSLMCLLGFTWIVGFLEVTQTPAAQYIFVVVNGLQGVFLFVSQVILNDNVYRKLFAIYKENFARFSSVTSSWNLMASVKAKPNLEEKPKQKGKVNEKDEFSSICIDEPKEQKIPQHALIASQLDLCKVRLRIMELAKEAQDPHPFGLNHEAV